MKVYDMKPSDAFPSRYLQTAVVKGKPIVATISHVEMETVGTADLGGIHRVGQM